MIGEVATEVPAITIGDWISDGGLVALLIVGLALIAAVFAVRCTLSLRMQRLAPSALQKSLEAAIHGGDLHRAAAEAAASGSMLGKLTAAGLRMKGLGLDEMLASVERAAARESVQLGNRVSQLSRLGGMVLLLGFLGSTLGFMIILHLTSATAGAPSYTELARGFATALSCLALALLAAMGCFGAFFFLDSRVTRSTILVSEIADELQHLVAEKAADAGSR